MLDGSLREDRRRAICAFGSPSASSAEHLQLDEANADYQAAIALYRTIGTHEISYALIGRGDVHRERGELALARAFYEEGLAIAERSGDLQASSPRAISWPRCSWTRIRPLRRSSPSAPSPMAGRISPGR